MGGKKKGGVLGSVGLGDNTIVGGLINNGVKTVSGGTISTNGTGYLENGNPLKGDTFVRGVAGGPTGGISDSYYAKKDMGEKLAAEAKKAAKTTQDKLLGAAKQREADELASKTETDNVARAKALQDRRSKGKGRASTILTSSEGTSSTLGQSGTGKALLGV
jgi:vacuolar-type H+-ATPase subunit H